jgi:hypothetical protein
MRNRKKAFFSVDLVLQPKNNIPLAVRGLGFTFYSVPRPNL